MDDLRDNLVISLGVVARDQEWDEITDFLSDEIVDAVLAEIAKTHRLVKLDGGPHGTYSRYTNGRCRCDLCREANRERGRRYRKEIKDRALAEAPHNCDKEFDPTCVYCVGADPIDWMG